MRDESVCAAAIVGTIARATTAIASLVICSSFFSYEQYSNRSGGGAQSTSRTSRPLSSRGSTSRSEKKSQSSPWRRLCPPSIGYEYSLFRFCLTSLNGSLCLAVL